MTTDLTAIFSYIDGLTLTGKQKNCLKLLSEEGLSLVGELLDGNDIQFDINNEGNDYKIVIKAQTSISEERRQQFLSVGSNKKNAKSKGLLGKLSAVFESMLYSYDANSGVNNSEVVSYMPSPTGLSYVTYWSLNDDKAYVKDEKEWDGLEKSIIANFSDNVTVGVRYGKVEMTINKKF